ncbi:hypothetical protein GGTG_13992 [Gaeumannomyces tritici R3-111a-1]|uniref:Uncharacterized protein n=1 Tax=Gaeumannomyces tritici (strain R3-111a-1) TaxID=644352 RepID=J3PKD8_GAET3|nr:hypothetical protein GGTG_13992 [Gaeumannomyces tritici R3-111a-1]EJT68431.1 hypothetical protein GGTG_13992 [Gaeumannomyces tritici R3-111a-1]
MDTWPSKKHTYSSTSSDSDLSTSSGSYTSSAGSGRFSMDSTAHPIVYVEVIRCMRCAKSAEMTSTDDASSSGMVQIGTNIYYCSRCAKMVGYK